MKEKRVKLAWLAAVLAAGIFLGERALFYRGAHARSQAALAQAEARLENASRRLALLREPNERLAYLEYAEFAGRSRAPLFHRILRAAFDSARRHGLNPYLVLAVIHLESGFNPQAVSGKGAYGLMQIHYSVWKDALQLRMDKIFEVEYNVDVGCRVLRRYLDESGGNLLRALYIYNNGYAENGNIAYAQNVLQGIFAARIPLRSG